MIILRVLSVYDCLGMSVLQESQVMLAAITEDTTAVQIPMESSKPVQTPKAHDPK